MSSMDESTEALAEQVRGALQDGDGAALRPLLADDAHWASCVGGAQIIDWMQRAVADGVEWTLTEVSAHSGRVVVGLEVTWPARESDAPASRTHFQVLFVRDGRIVELQDVATHEEALAAGRTELPTAGQQPSGMSRMAAVLPGRDLRAALAHYGRLGFEARAYKDGGYGYADRDGVSLHLSVVGDLDPGRNTSAIYLYVDDADVLFSEWRSSGAIGRFFEPTNTDYGLREGAHIDRDGNLIRFGSALAQA